jgi:hypothetical protein
LTTFSSKYYPKYTSSRKITQSSTFLRISINCSGRYVSNYKTITTTQNINVTTLALLKTNDMFVKKINSENKP